MKTLSDKYGQDILFEELAKSSEYYVKNFIEE